MAPWTELYRPENLGEVVGNEDAIENLRQWFDTWSVKAKHKAALLHGPAGTGKTSSVIALAKERGYELVEMNASDTRNKESIEKMAGSSAKEGTLTWGSTQGKRILLIDEVDGITGREDRGGLKSLIDIIAVASVPIICTANDAYDKKLSPLRKVTKVISYKPVHSEYILKVLKKIVRNQKIESDVENLQFIAENANGDLRGAINDLQGMVLQLRIGKATGIEMLNPLRDQTKQIQDALSDLFNSKGFIEGKEAIEGVNASYDELLLWVFENAYMHTSDKQLSEVYSTLAAADRFLGRIIRRQSWNLLSYFFDLVSGGVAVGIDKPTRKFSQYTYPQKIGMYAQTRFSRAIRDSIAGNISEKCHISISEARTESLLLVKEIMNGSIGDAAQLADWLELDENQIKEVVENSSSINKIKKVMSAIEEESSKYQTNMGPLKFSSFDQPGDDWSDILVDHEKRKAEILEAEIQKIEEEKRLKAEAKKAAKVKKKQEVKKEIKKKEEEEKVNTKKQDQKQVSLDDFF